LFIDTCLSKSDPINAQFVSSSFSFSRFFSLYYLLLSSSLPRLKFKEGNLAAGGGGGDFFVGKA